MFAKGTSESDNTVSLVPQSCILNSTTALEASKPGGHGQTYGVMLELQYHKSKQEELYHDVNDNRKWSNSPTAHKEWNYINATFQKNNKDFASG